MSRRSALRHRALQTAPLAFDNRLSSDGRQVSLKMQLNKYEKNPLAPRPILHTPGVPSLHPYLLTEKKKCNARLRQKNANEDGAEKKEMLKRMTPPTLSRLCIDDISSGRVRSATDFREASVFAFRVSRNVRCDSKGWFIQHCFLTFFYVTHTYKFPKNSCLECRVPGHLLEPAASRLIRSTHAPMICIREPS